MHFRNSCGQNVNNRLIFRAFEKLLDKMKIGSTSLGVPNVCKITHLRINFCGGTCIKMETTFAQSKKIIPYC